MQAIEFCTLRLLCPPLFDLDMRLVILWNSSRLCIGTILRFVQKVAGSILWIAYSSTILFSQKMRSNASYGFFYFAAVTPPPSPFDSGMRLVILWNNCNQEYQLSEVCKGLLWYSRLECPSHGGYSRWTSKRGA